MTTKASRAEAAPPSVSTCYTVNPLADPRWAALIEKHPLASVFHSLNWLQALRVAYGYEPMVVTTSPPGAALANGLVFCCVNSWLTGRRFVSLPFSDHCEPLVDSKEELDVMLEHMKQRVRDHKYKYVEIRPMANAWGGPNQLSMGITYLLHRLDLRPSAQELFRNFHKGCVQRKIRRAEREMLDYEEGTSEKLLRKFYRLLVMTRRRQHLPPQPLSWFRALIAAFGRDIRIRVASKNGTAVASILTLSHKKTMVYKYGCSDKAFSRVGGTALLFWKSIQEAKDNGFLELEMGRSDIDNVGLIAFKEHWGATRTVMHYWNWPPQPKGVSRLWEKKLTRQVVSVCPDIALEAVGKLLYKHIG
jgi:CelD/BcsL family acetyltransferase involved in cellulose biosynthesis